MCVRSRGYQLPWTGGSCVLLRNRLNGTSTCKQRKLKTMRLVWHQGVW